MPPAVPGAMEPSVLTGSSAAMAKVFRLIAAAAESDITVLLTGESGTGKTVAAHRIHALSRRRTGPFVQTNCASLPETLLDSELFGHERGAFTGAERRHAGKFELANGGTLFLDEIEELSPPAQAKLLDVIEEHAIMRVGGEELVPTDVRLIVATNADLAKLVAERRFRQDLLFRLSGLSIRMPALRERRSDIPELVAYFMEEVSAEFGESVRRVSDAAMAQLLRYDWPGNVRELHNVIRSAVARADRSAAWIEDFSLAVEVDPDEEREGVDKLGTLDAAERRHIEKVLTAVKWKKTAAAQILGITRATLDRKIAKHGLRKTTFG